MFQNEYFITHFSHIVSLTTNANKRNAQRTSPGLPNPEFNPYSISTNDTIITWPQTGFAERSLGETRAETSLVEEESGRDDGGSLAFKLQAAASRRIG